MLGVLTSLRDTIIRYAMASQPILVDAAAGQKVVKVPMSRKYFEGETVVLRDSTIGEINIIDKITDETTITLANNLTGKVNPAAPWTVAEGATFEKAPGGQYLKRIYLGDPDVIPDYPAITITADDRDEDWWTIGSTTPKWNCTVTCLFEDDGLENSYENMLLMVKSIESALWANRSPVLGKITETNLTSDLLVGSTSMTVADTSKIFPWHQALIEDYARTQHIEIEIVIDGNNIVFRPEADFNYLVSRGAKIIVPSRWVMWTKPGSTTYSYIHKGTLLKAAQIKWFCQEEVVRLNTRIGAVDL